MTTMVRTLNVTYLTSIDTVANYEFAGKSTDDKPTQKDIATGSTFFEVDTGDVYVYEEESGSWMKVGGDNA